MGTKIGNLCYLGRRAFMGGTDLPVQTFYLMILINFVLAKFLLTKYCHYHFLLFFIFKGLPSIIHSIILEKIEERLVWPNKQIKAFRDRHHGIHHMKCYESAGVLR